MSINPKSTSDQPVETEEVLIIEEPNTKRKTIAKYALRFAAYATGGAIATLALKFFAGSGCPFDSDEDEEEDETEDTETTED